MLTSFTLYPRAFKFGHIMIQRVKEDAVHWVAISMDLFALFP